MRTAWRILTGLAAIAGFIICWIGIKNGMYMIDHIEEWEGGVNFQGTMSWLYITLFGAGFTGFISFLALFGISFGPTGRKSAFWLLVLPGFLGLIVAIGALILLISHDPDWQEFGWLVLALLGTPALIYFASGIAFRKANPRIKSA